ncbi:hypothetical protein ACA910_006415 [Epithemia clementina (nom. ined.)]
MFLLASLLLVLLAAPHCHGFLVGTPITPLKAIKTTTTETTRYLLSPQFPGKQPRTQRRLQNEHSIRRTTGGFPSSEDVVSTRTSAKLRRYHNNQLSRTRLPMAGGGNSMDPITYLRLEWISAALCTNQTPRSANVCLQLGTQDGRAVTFLPRTIRQLVTSSLKSGEATPIGVQRQLKQSAERRQIVEKLDIQNRNQAADDLRETPDESVDVVISLQAVDRMVENGLNWKQSVVEAARVLKPGGRLLWVEPTMVQGESYVEYVESLIVVPDDDEDDEEDDDEDDDKKDNDEEYLPVFDDVGYDDIDWILQPHTAGVAVKRITPMTQQELQEQAKKAEQDKMAELSLQAFERGIKKRKKKKKRRRQGATADGE